MNPIQIVSGPRRRMSSAVAVLRGDFGGDLIEPGAAEYEAASRSLFASGSPAQILRPKSVRDVQAAVRFAARTGLSLSVRGGGHGFPGFATNDGGVVVSRSLPLQLVGSGSRLSTQPAQAAQTLALLSRRS